MLQDRSVLTEEDIARYEELQKYNREYTHGMLAVEAGRLKNILPEERETWISNETEDVRVATDDDVRKVGIWKGELEEKLQKQLRLEDDWVHEEVLQDEGDVM
jgi:hypothetical protein